MAISPKNKYPTQIDLTDPTGYPEGKARNVTVSGDGTGTPLEKDLVNDIFGFQQELLSKAGIIPSGNPDKVGASQYKEALDKLYKFKKLTTLELINNPNLGVPVGQVIETVGYATIGDGGGGTWKKTGNIIALSQTPALTGKATLSDANGNEFAYVVNAVTSSAEFPVAALGANTTAAADATLYTQAAVNAAGSLPRGGVVILPAGQLLHTATVTVLNNRVSIKGAGKFISGIVRNADYGDTFLINNGINGTTLEYFSVEGFTIFHDTAVNSLTQGANFNCVDVTHLEIKDIDQSNIYRGILLQGCVDVNIERNNIIGLSAKGALAGIHLIQNPNALVKLPTQVNIVQTQVFGAQIAGADYGLLIEAGEQVGVIGSYFGNATLYNVALIQGANNALILETSFDNTTYIDGAGVDSVLITGAAGDGSTYIGQTKFTGTNIKGQSGDSTHGITVDGTARGGLYDQACRDLSVVACTISGMNGSGLNLVGGVGTVITENKIKGNNYNNTTGGRGILLGANTDKTLIHSNYIGGNPEDVGVSLQTAGIEVVAGATNYDIQGNNTKYNVASIIDNGGDATSSNIKRVINNTGFNPQGAVTVSVPASGVALTNPKGYACWVSLFGGTVSDVSIDGQTYTTASPAMFMVAAGSTVTLTYAAAPSWVWWGQ